MLCGFVIICCWNRKSEEIVSDDKKIDWGMKLLLVIVGVNTIYLIINS
jgi:hypothetical protein